MNSKKWDLERKLDRDLVRLGAQVRSDPANVSNDRVPEAFEEGHPVLRDPVNGHQGS